MNLAPPPPIVDAESITKIYRREALPVRALCGVDVRVSGGEFVGVRGPSGSGKSTLLHILGCLDRPESGRYRLSGRDVSSCSDRELSALRAARIGFIFQSYNLLPQLTVLENTLLPHRYRRGPGREARARSELAVDRVGLWHRRHHRPAELSGGERQRTAIARALGIDPLLILADEPTGNLDSETAGPILDLFQELNKEGATIIVATHDPQVVGRCGRVLHLKDGRLEFPGRKVQR